MSEEDPEYYCEPCDVQFPVPAGQQEPVLCGVAGHPPMKLVEVRYVADTEQGQSGA